MACLYPSMCGTLIYLFVSFPGGRLVWYEDASTGRRANSLLWRLWMWPNSPPVLASVQKVKHSFSSLGDDCVENPPAVTFPELRIHIQRFLMNKHWIHYIQLEMNQTECLSFCWFNQPLSNQDYWRGNPICFNAKYQSTPSAHLLNICGYSN